MYPDFPYQLCAGPVRLLFSKFVFKDVALGLSSFFHFHILTKANVRAGHINFRITSTPHVRRVAGHVGYEVLEAHRGNGYAFQACLALVPLIRQYHDRIILTADPSNRVSIHIIEKLKARFLGEVGVPRNDPAYAGGARRKRRYEWIVRPHAETFQAPGQVNEHCARPVHGDGD